MKYPYIDYYNIMIDINAPMEGRESEIQSMMDSLATAMNERGRTILISGEAGIGKTRLCDEFEKKLSSLDIVFLKGKCSDDVMGPFGPFKKMTLDLISHLREDSRKNIMMSDFGRDPNGVRALASIFGEDERSRPSPDQTMFRFYDLISFLASKYPVVIQMEDLQWADASSIQLFHFIARNIAGTRAILIGTYRTEEIFRSGETGRSSIIFDTIRSLTHENLVDKIDLKVLPSQSMAGIIRNVLPGQIDEELLRPLIEVSEGNPLHIIETINWMLATKQISPEEGGLWKIQGNGPIDIPKKIVDVISKRLKKLTDEERSIINGAAVIGEEFDPLLLSSIMDIPPLTIFESLERLEKINQLVQLKGQVYKFAHEKIRRVAYDEIEESAKGDLHKRTALSIEQRGVSPDEFGTLSNHFHLAHVEDRCLEYSLKAGKYCIMRLDMYDALPFFSRVLEITKDNESMLKTRAEAFEGNADALMALEKYSDAIINYDQLLEISDDRRAIARGLRKKAECGIPGRIPEGSFDVFTDLLNEALAIEEIEPFEIGEVYSDLGGKESHQGHFSKAQKYYEMAIHQFSDIGAKGRLAKELAYYSDLLLTIGQTSEAKNALIKALTYIEKDNDPRNELEIRLCLGETSIHRGEYSEAETNLLIASDIGIKLGENGSACWANYYLALMLDDLNDVERALVKAEKSRDLAMKTESKVTLSIPCVVLAHLYARMGRLKDCKKICQDAVDLLSGYNEKTAILGMTDIVFGEICFFRGNFEMAKHHYSKAIDYFSGCLFETFYTALGEKWFANRLSSMGEIEQARIHYEMALKKYDDLNNSYEVARVEKELNLIA